MSQYTSNSGTSCVRARCIEESMHVEAAKNRGDSHDHRTRSKEGRELKVIKNTHMYFEVYILAYKKYNIRAGPA